MAQAGTENFPVAPRLLPPALRGHLTALYGFARLVDDIGDEAPGDRAARLDEVERDLDRLYARTRPREPVLAPLLATIHVCALPRAPFDALVQANRIDQRVHRYQTWTDLLGYCAYSANPVGHLVLHALRAATPDRLAFADRVCSALQVVEHLQDVREDLLRGRVYLPQQDLAAYGVREADLAGPRATLALRRLVRHEATRAAGLLDAGAPLVASLRGWPRLAVAGFVGGGRAALRALARTGYDVLPTGPRPTRTAMATAAFTGWARGR